MLYKSFITWQKGCYRYDKTGIIVIQIKYILVQLKNSCFSGISKYAHWSHFIVHYLSSYLIIVSPVYAVFLFLIRTGYFAMEVVISYHVAPVMMVSKTMTSLIWLSWRKQRVIHRNYSVPQELKLLWVVPYHPLYL
jgi:hypothetical protein